MRPDVLDRVIDRIARTIGPGIDVQDLHSFLGTKSGKLLSRYTAAARDVLKYGFYPHGSVNPKDMEIGMFLKTEIYAEEQKDPRMISGCSTKFILGFAHLASALERALKLMPQVMSGKNLVQRGEAFAKLVYPHSLYTKSDYSRFDSSQRVECQWGLVYKLLEKLVCLGYLSDEHCHHFLKFLEQETEKHGRYPHGLTFVLIGCMASGSILTKMLNTLINLVVLAYTCEINGIDWDFLVDGDDGDLGHDKPISFHFHEFGLDAKAETVTDYHDIDFCSSKFLMVRPGVFHQIQDFRKVYNNIGIIKSKHMEHCASAYYYSLAVMFDKLYPGCPGFSEMSSFLKRGNGTKYPSNEILRDLHPQFDSWAPQGDLLPFDYPLVLNEMVIAYGLSHAEFNYMLLSLNDMKISLPKVMCKRYRSAAAPTAKLTKQEADLVQGRILTSVLCAQPPPLLRSIYHREIFGFITYTEPPPKQHHPKTQAH